MKKRHFRHQATHAQLSAVRVRDFRADLDGFCAEIYEFPGSILELYSLKISIASYIALIQHDFRADLDGFCAENHKK